MAYTIKTNQESGMEAERVALVLGMSLDVVAEIEAHRTPLHTDVADIPAK